MAARPFAPWFAEYSDLAKFQQIPVQSNRSFWPYPRPFPDARCRDYKSLILKLYFTW
jgi:hypothetical protein